MSGVADLTGRVALVTGGGRGLGEGIARHLAGRGADVHVADIDLAAARAVADTLGGIAVRADVGSFADNETCVATAIREFGRLDIAVLNAGVISGCGLAEASPGSRPPFSISWDAVREPGQPGLLGPAHVVLPEPALTEVVRIARGEGNTSSSQQIYQALITVGLRVEHPTDADVVRAAELLEISEEHRVVVP